MENAELLLSFIGTALSLAAMCVVFTVRLVRALAVKKKTLADALFDEAITALMEIAEAGKGSGEEKKRFVLERLKELSQESGVSVDIEAAAERIEEVIELSKRINFKNKKGE